MNESSQFCLHLEDAEIKLFWGNVQNKNEIVCPLHFHQYTECHLITKGDCCIHTEKEHFSLQAGEICIVPNLVYHGVKSFSPDIEKCTFLLSLRHTKDKEPGLYKILRTLCTSDHIHIIKDEALYALFIQIATSNALSDFAKDVKLKSLFTLILYSFAEYMVSTEHTLFPNRHIENQDTPDRIHEIERYIDNYYMEDITLKTLSDYLHLSERQINRILKQQSGLGFKDLLIRQRMLMAKELLQDSSLSLTEIAKKVGFHSYSGFYYCVRKFWGIHPDKLRKAKTFLVELH